MKVESRQGCNVGVSNGLWSFLSGEINCYFIVVAACDLVPDV